MGLNVHLYIQYSGICEEKWREVYDESLKLLYAFPTPLLRLDLEKNEEKKRYVLTKKIVKNEGQEIECWQITGDQISRKRAETFELFRNEIERRKSNKNGLQGYKPGKHILWANKENLEYSDGNGVNLFGSKTQGYPYHMAVLAVALLIENRFPDNAYLNGDVDDWQIKQIIPWMENILQTPMQAPICVSGERLWKCLSKIFPHEKDVMVRFEAIFSGNNENRISIPLSLANKQFINSYLIEKLEEYESLSQRGAILQILNYFNTVGDLRKTIDWVCLPIGQRKFKLKDILQLFCDLFINIPFEMREFATFLQFPETGLKTIEDRIFDTFKLMLGAPEQINVYLTKEQLLDIFSSYNPNETEKFRSIIEDTYKEQRFSY